MKKIFASVLLASLALFSYNVGVAAETKKVCVDKITKDGKPVQECKEMKVHKKLEGTEVPPAKK